MNFSTVKLRQFFDAMMARLRPSQEVRPSSGESSDNVSLIPESSQDVHARLRELLDQATTIKNVGHDEFMRGWISIFHIAPALNPDEAASEDGGWPAGWALLAAEAFRRFELKELTKEELYPRLSGLL